MIKPPQRLKELNKKKYEKVLKRSQVKIDEVIKVIIPIIKEVEEEGDEAVLRWTKKLDKVNLKREEIFVKEERIKEAYKRIKPEVLKALRRMEKQLKDFHIQQKRSNLISYRSFPDGGEYQLGQKFVPLERVGVYVPGGKGNYPSTVMMGVVPAKIAGVKKIILASPPSQNGEVADEVMVAADIAGADCLIKVGGVQAIAALAYGTQTIPSVDLIVGPGNIYVTAAKAYLSAIGKIAIDCPAGPSEILIIADESANSEYIAQDLLSQAEHDENACAVLVTSSEKLARNVYLYLKEKFVLSARKEIIEKSLGNYGAILIVDSLKEAVNFANEFAPEHLEIMTEKPEKIFDKINNAGSVFLGDFSPVPAGDYLTGTNHILPTAGAAKRFSGLSVDTFLKRLTFQSLSKEALSSISKDIITLASQEGPFEEHINAIKLRLHNF